MVPLVLQARGDEGAVQADRRATRLLLLRLRARARLARVPAQLGRSEQAPAHAPGRAREGARWTDDRRGLMWCRQRSALLDLPFLALPVFAMPAVLVLWPSL